MRAALARERAPLSPGGWPFTQPVNYRYDYRFISRQGWMQVVIMIPNRDQHGKVNTRFF